MTTIAGLAVDGHIVIGADTCTNVYDRPLPGAARKVRRLRTTRGDDFLLAFCGAGALPEWVCTKLTVERLPGDDDHQQWASAMAWAVGDLARDAGLVSDGQMDGSILLGACGRLWTLSQYGAIPHVDGVAALGSGEGPAIGALDALLPVHRHLQMGMSSVIEQAVRIGIARDRYSLGPVQLEHLPA